MNYAQTSGLGYPDGAGGVRVASRSSSSTSSSRNRSCGRWPEPRSDEADCAGACGIAGPGELLRRRATERRSSSSASSANAARVYGHSIDIAKAEGECGIITTMINRFDAENPDIHVESNVVAWPGYAQLSAQIAARRSARPGDDAPGRDHRLCSAGTGRADGADPARSRYRSWRLHRRRAARRDQGRPNLRLPWDTIGGLFHINTALFAKAGLMRERPAGASRLAGRAACPGAAVQARDGKPYLIQSQVNDPGDARAQSLHLSAGSGRGDFSRRQAHPPRHAAGAPHRRAAQAAQCRATEHAQPGHAGGDRQFHQRRGRHLPDRHVDDRIVRSGSQHARAAALQELCGLSLTQGCGATRRRSSTATPGSCRSTSAARRSARRSRASCKFMADHNYDWARTGHIPAFKSVLADPRFAALPHRTDIAPLGSIGRTLPGVVRRQGAIEGIVGEELQAAVTGQKPVGQALADAEHRSNVLLAQVD